MAAGSTMRTELSLSTARFADCRLVEARGRVDHTNAPSFLETLKLEAESLGKGGGLVIDLSGLAFITSAGLRALMQTKTLLARHGGRLVVAGTQGTVAEVIRIARFDTLLALAPTAREGLALLSPEAAAAFDD